MRHEPRNRAGLAPIGVIWKLGRALLNRLGAPCRPVHLLMDRAYEGNETRQLALDYRSDQLIKARSRGPFILLPVA